MKIFRRIDIDSCISCSKENEEELREPIRKKPARAGSDLPNKENHPYQQEITIFPPPNPNKEGLFINQRNLLPKLKKPGFSSYFSRI
jgi:hypothetical protein